MPISIQAEQRTADTRGALRQLRNNGKVPAVVYGKRIAAPASIAVDEKELMALLRSHPNAVIEMDVPGAGRQSVMVTNVQRDALTRRVLHVDLHQIDMNEQVKTQVRIDLVGDSAGVREGGILSVNLHELEVQCLPRDIPESIVADISSLGIGDSLTVGGLKLPDGVVSVTEGDTVIATVMAPQKEVTEEEAERASDAETEDKAQRDQANLKETKEE